MDGVDPMELRGGNMDITGISPRIFTPVPLDDGLIGLATLDETLDPDMVGG